MPRRRCSSSSSRVRGSVPEESRANNIGTLRLIGALAVLFGHSFVLTEGVPFHDPISDVTRELAGFSLGLPGLGVAMFFAISGYLVTRSWMRHESFVAYAEARLLRIYPALILAVALTVLLGLVLTDVDGAAYLTSKQTVEYAIHDSALIDLRYTLPGVFEDNPSNAVNGSLWTLPVEMRMYILVALAGLLGMLRRRMLFNIAAAGIVVLYLAWPESPLLADPVHARAAVFFLMGAALLVNRDWAPLTGLGAAGMAALAALASFTGAYDLVFAIAFAYVILWLGFTDRVRMPNLAAHGDLSYGTYLYAFPVTQLWVQMLQPVSPWVVFLLSLATVLPLAWMSWHVLEQNALRLKGRLRREQRAATPHATTV
jgi:peptidoglycan/LPS O-acetylase OafA/YrhL